MECPKSLLNSVCYNEEMIFEFIMKENNITFLLGDNIFVTSFNMFFSCIETSQNNIC